MVLAELETLVEVEDVLSVVVVDAELKAEVVVELADFDVVDEETEVELAVVVVVVVFDLAGPTNVSDSISGGRGVCEKLKEFSMSFALSTRGAVGCMLNIESASLIIEANS